MRTLSLKKGQILQHKGELNSKIYLVKSGLLRSFYLDKRGKEHIFMFAPEGWIVADTQGPEVPTELFIDAIEASTVVEMDKDLEREQANVGSLVKRMAVLQNRVIMLLSMTAIERYEAFIQTYPDILQRVPQRMIASYLGVTPEALSASKKEWLKRKREIDNS